MFELTNMNSFLINNNVGQMLEVGMLFIIANMCAVYMSSHLMILIKLDFCVVGIKYDTILYTSTHSFEVINNVIRRCYIAQNT